MRKKLFNIALSAIMVIAMAVPAFAGEPIRFCEYESKESDTAINVYGNNTIAPGRNVCMWGGAVTSAQRWSTKMTSNGNYRLTSDLNSNYALNVYRVKDSKGRYNCTVNLYASYPSDTEFCDLGLKIAWLYNTNFCVGTDEDINNSNVYFTNIDDTSSYKLWYK